MASPDRQLETVDDLDALLAALPPEIVDAVHALPDRTALIEVVLDLGRRPEARFPDSEVTLLEREITDADIAFVVEHIGTFGDDNRAGIERTLHRISAIRNRARQDRRADVPHRARGVTGPSRSSTTSSRPGSRS